MKYLYLIAPILALAALVSVYFLIQTNKRPVPHYEFKAQDEIVWSPEDYYKHLKAKPFTQREVHRLLVRRTLQKPGVYLESLEPALDSAGIEIVNIYHKVLGDDYTPVITSGNDWPYHTRFSKHYANKALDFRIKFIPVEKRREIVERCQKQLEGRFRVLWEKGDAEHLHVEMLE
ncbi:MAG: hypothetical protein MJY82_01530 [Fibrobacter sp.]|nr:hypothetical protein [Fibrobacter sp.]